MATEYQKIGISKWTLFFLRTKKQKKGGVFIKYRVSLAIVLPYIRYKHLGSKYAG